MNAQLCTSLSSSSVVKTKRRILVVDDDTQIRRVLHTSLQAAGYDVEESESGEIALEVLGLRKFDVVLLDVNLPGKSGIEICREVRTRFSVPIIMVTVRDLAFDKVDALDLGAYDYVTKPFSMRELMARIRSVLRRTASVDVTEHHLKFDNIEMDFEARKLTISGERVRLTAKEFDLLYYFASHPNRIIPHRELLQNVWGFESVNELKYLRVFINRLRKKMEPFPHEPRYLLTAPYVGYRFEVPR